MFFDFKILPPEDKRQIRFERRGENIIEIQRKAETNEISYPNLGAAWRRIKFDEYANFAAATLEGTVGAGFLVLSVLFAYALVSPSPDVDLQGPTRIIAGVATGASAIATLATFADSYHRLVDGFMARRRLRTLNNVIKEDS